MSQTICQPRKSKVSSSQPLCNNEERTVSLRAALGLVARAERVAFATVVNSKQQSVIVDVSRAVALRALRTLKGRVKAVRLADLFGTLTVGM